MYGGYFVEFVFPTKQKLENLQVKMEGREANTRQLVVARGEVYK
jgi:hypothetical protein